MGPIEANSSFASADRTSLSLPLELLPQLHTQFEAALPLAPSPPRQSHSLASTYPGSTCCPPRSPGPEHPNFRGVQPVRPPTLSGPAHPISSPNVIRNSGFFPLFPSRSIVISADQSIGTIVPISYRATLSRMVVASGGPGASHDITSTDPDLRESPPTTSAWS